MNKCQEFTYKTVAIIFAWFAWLIPLGLHRIMMRRRYAWLHPIAFLMATLASNQFFNAPENVELGRMFIEQGIASHFGQFSHNWLVSFTVAWMLLVIYDAIMIFSWSVNNPHVLQVADHDQAAQ
jgi:hypothetical protein